MGTRLGRFDEVRIIDETNGFVLDFVEKTESRFWSTTTLVDWTSLIFKVESCPLPFHLRQKIHASYGLFGSIAVLVQKEIGLTEMM